MDLEDKKHKKNVYITTLILELMENLFQRSNLQITSW